MRPTQLLAAVVAMSSVTNALSGAFDNIHGMDDVKNVLLGRQDDNSDASSQAPRSSSPPRSSNQPSATQKDDNKPSATQKDDNKDNKDNASQTNQASGSAKVTGSQGSKTITGKPQATSFDPRIPAGGISMVTPNALAGDQFYKVGDYITFAWNYTSLSVTPSAIDVLATCTQNQATYTIAVNISAQETQVVWDTKNPPKGQAPFLTNKYTLLIYDAESSVTAAPRAGYLAVFNQFTFGMYTPQPYVAWSDYNCPTCIKNGALSHHEKMNLKVMLFTSGTTIASLIYFAHGFGLW